MRLVIVEGQTYSFRAATAFRAMSASGHSVSTRTSGVCSKTPTLPMLGFAPEPGRNWPVPARRQHQCPPADTHTHTQPDRQAAVQSRSDIPGRGEGGREVYAYIYVCVYIYVGMYVYENIVCRHTRRAPAALRVAARTGVAPGAGAENGRLAGRHGGGRRVEDEGEARGRRGGHAAGGRGLDGWEMRVDGCGGCGFASGGRGEGGGIRWGGGLMAYCIHWDALPSTGTGLAIFCIWRAQKAEITSSWLGVAKREQMADIT